MNTSEVIKSIPTKQFGNIVFFNLNCLSEIPLPFKGVGCKRMFSFVNFMSYFKITCKKFAFPK